MSAFTEFVQARGEALWRAAWLLTGDRAAAEDLLQATLVKAWPHFDRVSRDGSFEAYVRTALVTTYVGWRRRRWWGEVPTETLPEPPPNDGADVDGGLDVGRALATLSPRQRAVLVLRYYGDHTEAETARVLGCSVASVKTHHARALERLRAGDLLTAPDPEETS
jgi:RNA polymerase sigma-70 factor (sigma-E family)